MRIQGLVFLIAALLFGSCSKKEANYVQSDTAVFNAFQRTIDTASGIHHQIFEQATNSAKLEETQLAGNKEISGRRLFKTAKGHIAGLYDLWIEGKISSAYKVLIVDDSTLTGKLFFLKRLTVLKLFRMENRKGYLIY